MKVCEEFYINGEWVKPVNGLKTLDVINPATEEVFGRIALGDKTMWMQQWKLLTLLLKLLALVRLKKELVCLKKY